MNEMNTLRAPQFLTLSILLLLLFGCPQPTPTPTPSPNDPTQSYSTFAKSYGGPLNDNFAAVSEITVDNYQQFIAAGNVARSYYYDTQTIGLKQKGDVLNSGAIWVSGLDANGDYLWQKGLALEDYQPVGTDKLNISRVTFDNIGGFWLAGGITKVGQLPKLFVRRLSANGDIVTTQEITLTIDEPLTRLRESDKGWAVEVVASKSAANGDLLLLATLRAAIDALDENNNVLGTTLEHHAFLIRLDSLGNLIWSSHLPIPSKGSANLYTASSIAQLSTGPIVLSTGDNLFGFTSTGARLWQQQKTIRQLDVSNNQFFTFMSVQNDANYFQKIDSSGQLVSNEILLDHEIIFMDINGQVTREGRALSYAEACVGTLSGSCEMLTHSDHFAVNDVNTEIEHRKVRRISVDTGEVLGELTIGDPNMKIVRIFFDETNQTFRVFTVHNKDASTVDNPDNKNRTLTLFRYSPSLVLESVVEFPSTLTANVGNLPDDWWMQWDAQTQRLLFNTGFSSFFLNESPSRAPSTGYIENFGANIFRIQQLDIANLSVSPISLNPTITIDVIFPIKFELDDLVSSTDGHFIVANAIRRDEDEYRYAQSIIHLDTNGELSWQKQWLSNTKLANISEPAIFSGQNDSLMMLGQDVEQSWGGVLSFTNASGIATASLNVVPTGYQFDGNLKIAQNSQGQYIAGEQKALQSFGRNEALWLTKLDPTGGISWQFDYKLYENANLISSTLEHIVADESALYLLARNTHDYDQLIVIKLNLQGGIVWASAYRLGIPEARLISTIRASINSAGELLIAASEQHRNLNPNEVLASGDCDDSDDSLYNECLYQKNLARAIETGYQNITLLKLDSEGEALWTKRYGGLYEESVADILSASNGGFLIGGRSDSLGVLGEAMLIRTDEQGEVTSTCQLARPATLVSITRDNLVPLRSSYESSEVDYLPIVEDANYVTVDLPVATVARSCSGIATDPTEGITPIVDHDLFITIVGNGSVISTPSGITCPDDCSESYTPGDDIQLQVLPAPGWVFEQWSGETGCASELTMPNANKACVAEFRELGGDSVTLTVIIQGGPGAGQVNSMETLPKMQCINSNELQTVCTAVYEQGDNVDLLAEAFSTKNQIGWIGCEEYSGNRCILTMTDNQTVTVSFSELTQYTLSLNVTGGGRLFTRDGKLDCAGGNIGTCSASYTAGSNVVVEQSPDIMQQLLNWSGDGACGSGGSLVSLPLTINNDSQCNGDFSGSQVNEYGLCTRVTNETGSAAAGSIQRNINGRLETLTAPSMHCEYYPENSQVTLIPQANTGFGFYRWDGFSCANNMIRQGDTNQPNTRVDLPPNATCTAVFRDDVNRLQVNFGGGFSERGDKVISVSPSGGRYIPFGDHSCEENCNEPVLTSNGQAMWLKAIPVSTRGNDTAGWQGCDRLLTDPEGSPQICQVNFQQQVGEQREVSANFTHFVP